MKRIVTIYGLISGSIIVACILLSIPFWNNGTLTLENGELYGYTTMVISLSLVFFGIKSYRDNHSNGVITFGKAFKIGLLISLIASVMYSLAWEISLVSMPDFVARMNEYYITALKNDGATDAEIQQLITMQGYYQNPLIRFWITIIVEILPVGIVITLISAALLRKKEFLPATEPA